MPLGSVSPFRPTGTVSVSVGIVSANVRLAGGGDSVVVTSTATGLSYVRFGPDPTVAASASDMPILPTTRLLLSVNSLISHAAAVCPSGTGSLLFTRGDGSFL